jgi:hypothetical protein
MLKLNILIPVYNINLWFGQMYVINPLIFKHNLKQFIIAIAIPQRPHRAVPLYICLAMLAFYLFQLSTNKQFI